MRVEMAITRPEDRETTGTLRETSGATVPVTTNSEVVGCSVAAASGNWSGWSTEKRAASANGTTLASGGAPSGVSPLTLLQACSSSKAGRDTARRIASTGLGFIRGLQSAGCASFRAGPASKPWDHSYGPRVKSRTYDIRKA